MYRQVLEKLCHNQFTRIHGRSEIENGPFCAILKSVTPTRANFDLFFQSVTMRSGSNLRTVVTSSLLNITTRKFFAINSCVDGCHIHLQYIVQRHPPDQVDICGSHVMVTDRFSNYKWLCANRGWKPESTPDLMTLCFVQSMVGSSPIGALIYYGWSI